MLVCVRFFVEPVQPLEKFDEKVVAAHEIAVRVGVVLFVVLRIRAQKLAVFKLFVVPAEHRFIDEVRGRRAAFYQTADVCDERAGSHSDGRLAGAARDDGAVQKAGVLFDERLREEGAVRKAEQNIFDVGEFFAVVLRDARHVLDGIRKHFPFRVAERFRVGIAVAAVVVRHDGVAKLVQAPREFVVAGGVLVHAVGDLHNAARLLDVRPFAHENFLFIVGSKDHDSRSPLLFRILYRKIRNL